MRFRPRNKKNNGQRPFRRPFHHNNRNNSHHYNNNNHSRPPEPSEAERSFFNKISVDPAPRIRLETGFSDPTTRAVDLIAPIGMGQRGLIVSPPKSGKTTFLKNITKAITAAQPDMKVYCLLVDERPEEVTDFRRNVTAEVRWSSTDQPYENHIRVAQELMKEAVEKADAGENVMVLIDSLTRLARVHNSAVRSGGRTMSGGVDARGLLIPRKIFGSARKIENGGSLGIIATILVETGSRMDDVIFQEFKGTGNMELVLSRKIAERRIFPAINIRESGTRKEELLFDEDELKSVRLLRGALAEMDDVAAAQELLSLLEKTTDNKAMLAQLEIN